MICVLHVLLLSGSLQQFVGTVSANVAPPSRSPTATKVLLDRAFLDGIQVIKSAAVRMNLPYCVYICTAVISYQAPSPE